MRAYQKGRSDAFKTSAKIISKSCANVAAPPDVRDDCLCVCCVARLRILAELYVPAIDEVDDASPVVVVGGVV